MKISRSCFRTVLAGPILAAFAWPALCRADEVMAQGASGSPDNFYHTNISQSGAASIAHTGGGGTVTVNSGYGSIHVFTETANTGPQTGILFGGTGYWDEFRTINNASLTGQAGTASITYHVTGNFPVNQFTQGSTWWDLGNLSIGSNYGQQPNIPGAINYSFTLDYGFTFGSPFEIKRYLHAQAQAVSFPGITNAVDVTLTQGGMTVSSNASPVGFTSTANSGSAAAVPVANGANYAGFTLTNASPYGHGSTASILGGVASTDSVVEATFLAQAAGFTLASDIVDFTGFGTSKHVLQLSYDPAIATSLFGSEANAVLRWMDPVSGLFENAVFGNSDGGAQSHAFSGAYNPATEFVLGDYGVDTTNHVVWAVVDHNSEFGVGQVAPEPGTWVMLVSGIGSLGLCRRRRAV